MRPGLKQVRDSQFGAFTAWQVACEYSRAEMRARIDRGEWVRVFHGVYREANTPLSPVLRVEAARLSIGAMSLAAGYHTAAELHGFAVLDGQATHVLGMQHSRSKQIVVHRDRVEPAELEVVGGVLATDAARTAVDVARVASRVDALATLDSAICTGLTREALVAEVSRHMGRRGYQQATELIELADGRAVSPMDSRAGARCIDTHFTALASKPASARRARCARSPRHTASSGG
ncbi:hypothetical protein [Nocardia australiensis]|uniref:hypothetical protein n=1 Tax=Nocardia australiensis TaxID=2887191 RepID=UPI001D148AC4|nr:hypothetical protein [Nocardia australiensis]